MNIVKVAAAIIVDKYPNPKKVYGTKKGYGKFKGLWEFPGGKIEENETSREALKREIREELCADINILYYFIKIKYKYSDFILDMDTYICTLKEDKPILKEAMEDRWFHKDELDNVIWIEGDRGLVMELKKLF